MNPFDPERGDLSFLEANAGNERKRWACPKCGDIISSHNGICLQCGKGATDRKMAKTKQTHFSQRNGGPPNSKED
jgi:ribosomal protein S27AE